MRHTVLVIVLAPAVALGVIALGAHSACGCRSKRDLGALAVDRFAHDGYPRWALDQARRRCPTTLHELDPKRPDRDPWNTPYAFRCGAGGIVVTSAGADRRFGTADDLRSDR